MKTERAAPAPATQHPINREAVRLLAIEHGVREAARLTGLNEDRVRQWSSRFKWLHNSQGAKSNGAVTTVTTLPGDSHLHELQTHERETRLSLARSARKLATEAESAKLNESSHILNVAKTAAVVHKWGDEKQNVQFSLNVLNLNMLSENDGPVMDT